MDSTQRLQIATRIHYALLRHLGEGIDVGVLLRSRAEAREVMWVCQASGDEELIALARQFEACAMPPAVRAGAPAPPATPRAWASDTGSGFATSRPSELAEWPTARVRRGWLSPASWMRRSPPKIAR